MNKYVERVIRLCRRSLVLPAGLKRMAGQQARRVPAFFDILVVEDDDKIRGFFTRFLSAAGHRVKEAQDGQEAVQVACRQRFDLVLMDVKMPKLDGISAFRQIRQASPSTKVVLVTGFDLDGELKQELLRGTVECLQKPLLLHDLEALLARMTAPDKGNGSVPPESPSRHT
jgi:CheY-like chemotaxis protein